MKAQEPIQLSDSTFWITVNANLIFSENQGILVDTSFSTENLKRILSILKQLEINNLIVVNTHTHYHHAGNNKLLLQVFPNAKLYAPREQIIRNEKKQNDGIISKFILEDNQIISLKFSDIKIKVIYSGGHTIDHTMYLINDYGKKILFAGDIIHSISQIYSSIGPIPNIAQPNVKLLEQYLRALEVIKKERPTIICGHTCIGMYGEPIFLTIRKTERILGRINELIKENWCSYLSEKEIARRVFIELCNELRYNPNIRFSEKLKSGESVYEKYDLPILLAMIEKYKRSIVH